MPIPLRTYIFQFGVTSTMQFGCNGSQNLYYLLLCCILADCSPISWCLPNCSTVYPLLAFLQMFPLLYVFLKSMFCLLIYRMFHGTFHISFITSSLPAFLEPVYWIVLVSVSCSLFFCRSIYLGHQFNFLTVCSVSRSFHHEVLNIQNIWQFSFLIYCWSLFR